MPAHIALIDQSVFGVCIDIWPWNGIILSAPLVVPDRNVATPFMKMLARFASRWFPKLSPTRLDARAVSRFHSVVENYRSDRLVYNGNIRARWGWEVLKMTADLKSALSSINFPFFVIQGTADRLVEPDGATVFYNGAASIDKTIKLYNGFYHELFNDLDHDKVVTDVVGWMQPRIPL